MLSFSTGLSTVIVIEEPLVPYVHLPLFLSIGTPSTTAVIVRPQL